MIQYVGLTLPDEDVRKGPRTDSARHEPLAYMYDFKACSILIDATFRSKEGIAEAFHQLEDGVFGSPVARIQNDTPSWIDRVRE